jgi:hypothetical protein
LLLVALAFGFAFAFGFDFVAVALDAARGFGGACVPLLPVAVVCFDFVRVTFFDALRFDLVFMTS